MDRSVKMRRSWLLKDAVDGSRKMDEDKKQQEMQKPYVPDDCISNVLIRVSHDSLMKCRFVCKQWYYIMSSPMFIKSHLQHGESVLIFLRRLQNRKPDLCKVLEPLECSQIFSVEAKWSQTAYASIFSPFKGDCDSRWYVQFMEFKDGKCMVQEYKISCLGNMRATCSGLVLLDNKLKEGGLIVLNPVTRELTALPAGTLFPSNKESYGFGFSNSTWMYKVVHLFMEPQGCICCEIINLESKRWRAVDGPSDGLIRRFAYRPVFSIGALHWCPKFEDYDYIVSMDIEEEKFYKIMLPNSNKEFDGILEMNGYLACVTHVSELEQIDIWILKDIYGDVWKRHHRILVYCMYDIMPLCYLRIKGDLIFRRIRDGSLYSYDFQLEIFTKVKMEDQYLSLHAMLLPHVNSLVSVSGRMNEEGLSIV